mgnify:CR=1 FL=1
MMHPCVEGLTPETNLESGLLVVTHRLYEAHHDRFVDLIVAALREGEGAKGSLLAGLSAAYEAMTRELWLVVDEWNPGLTKFIREMQKSADPCQDGVRMAIEDALQMRSVNYECNCHVGPLSPAAFATPLAEDSDEDEEMAARMRTPGNLGDDVEHHRDLRRWSICTATAARELPLYPERME